MISPMFNSNDGAFLKPSNSSSIFLIFRIRNGFLGILWFSFIKLDNNMTVSLCFGWINVGLLTHIYLPFKITRIGEVFTVTSCIYIHVLFVQSMF